MLIFIVDNYVRELKILYAIDVKDHTFVTSKL